MLSNKYAQTLCKFISSKQKLEAVACLYSKKPFRNFQKIFRKKTWDSLIFIGTKTVVTNFTKKEIHTSIFL